MIFEFDSALVREPGQSVIHGLSSQPGPRPPYANVVHEHAQYVAALVLIGEEFPRTLDLLRSNGYTVKPLPVANIGKLDAGLSCMSLRWKKTQSGA